MKDEEDVTYEMNFPNIKVFITIDKNENVGEGGTLRGSQVITTNSSLCLLPYSFA